MLIEIKHRYTGKVILSGEYESIRDCLKKNRGADLRDAYLGDADLRGADLRGADLGGADLRDAYLGDADLRDADLGGAYLGGAYLRGADLRGADLGGADLRGAYLGGADFRGAKGITLPIISISGSAHNLYYQDGSIRIGCEHHPVQHWIENYAAIGKENDYTDAQIAEYAQYIRFCSQFATKESDLKQGA